MRGACSSLDTIHTHTMKQSFTQEIKNIVQRHLDEQQLINVSLLAEYLQLDRTQVYRKLKKETGKSPAILIRETKLAYGKAILQESNETITTIAYRSGFTNANYFIRCFREEYGNTPQEYRQKITNTT